MSDNSAAFLRSRCEHYWIPNSGRGGEPVFKRNSTMHAEPIMHVRCSQCGNRTWFTERQWNEIPVRSEPGAVNGGRE